MKRRHDMERVALLCAGLALGACASAGPVTATPTQTPSPVAPATAGAPGPIAKETADAYAKLLADATQAYAQGDADRALALLGQAMQLLPAEGPAYVMSGVVLYGTARAAAAAPQFKRGIELGHGELKVRMLRQISEVTGQARSPEEQRLLKAAFDATEAGHPDQALAPLQRALDLNPANARTRYEIGYAMISLGRVDDAIPQLEEERRINPVYRALLAELQYCYAERQRFAEMRGVVADRVLVEGEQPGLLHELGYAYAATGNTDVAIGTLEDNLLRHPAFFLSHFSLGQLYCDRKKDAAKGRAHLDAFVAAAEKERRNPGDREGSIPSAKLETALRDAQSLQRSCGN